MRPLRRGDLPSTSDLFKSLPLASVQTGQAREVPSPQTGDWDENPLEYFSEVLCRTADLDSSDELFRLLLGRAEEQNRFRLVPEAAEEWQRAPKIRNVSVHDTATSTALPVALKRLFNFYFQHDLYGHWICKDPIVMSSGSFDESEFGLPSALKSCIHFALDQNWYGYSDSCGRIQTREALAVLESILNSAQPSANSAQIAVTLGGTSAIRSIIEVLAQHASNREVHALCAIPNYAPLVAAAAAACRTTLVPMLTDGTSVDIENIISSAGCADIILLQTVVNPWGLAVALGDLQRLIDIAPNGCTIILDACHDHFSDSLFEPARLPVLGRRGAKVLTVRSLSKRWAAPGLKCGWIRGDESFIEAFYDYASTSYGSPPSVFSLMLEVYALFEANSLTGIGLDREYCADLQCTYGLSDYVLKNALESYSADRNQFENRVFSRRDWCCAALKDFGIDYIQPSHSINILARASEASDYTVYRRLVERYGVSVFPPSLCYSPAVGTFRISPCISEATLDEGLSRICDWVTKA